MLPLTEIILRLSLAAALGAVVGAERERVERGAGIRTYALVSLGSCLFMLVSAFAFWDFGDTGHRADPTRIAAQVVSGIGFLCAGTIITRRDTVHGLTTAAGIWAAAAIGLAVGGGLFPMALVATALMLVLLAVVQPIEHRIFGRGQSFALTIVVAKDTVPIATLRSTVEAAGLRIAHLDVHVGTARNDRVKLAIAGRTAEHDTTIVESLRHLAGVRSVKLRGA